jgi:hypothetical protein
MFKKHIFWICLLLLFSSIAKAQNTYSIAGTIRDQKETLPGAAVYLSGYKIATVTNNEGKFTLPNLKPGNYDILVQMIGYLPYSKNIIISDKSVNIEIMLSENLTMLKEIVIKPDPNRAYYINLFKEYFIGKSPNAAQCKILNTDRLQVTDQKAERMVTFNATDFLIIENQALGYRIKYLLQTFEYDYHSKIYFYAGHPTFEELKGSKSKQARWEKNRLIAYNGSIQHFFQSLYQNRITEEGFVINKRSEVKNPKKLPDSLIKANIKRLITGTKAAVNLMTYNGGNDSLSYWMKQRQEPSFFNVLNRSNVLVDTLVKKLDNNLKYMSFKDELFIIYQNEKETVAYDHSGFKINRSPDMGNQQVSIIKMLGPSISFYESGAVFNPRSALYSGYWAYEKVADLMPLDYKPILKRN